VTDHLDEAAAKAVELAEELFARTQLDLVPTAQHLTYVAGLIRGGAVRPGPVEETRCADCEEMLHRNAEVRADRAMIRAQRDELLAAVKDLLQHDDVRRIVRRPFLKLIDRIEAE
jgi:hypothetical protein